MTYRAGLGVDRRNDEADRAAGRRIECPGIVGHGIDSTHHVAENAPAELVTRLVAFL